MKDDWPIATQLYNPGPPIGWRQGLALAIVTLLICGFFAVMAGAPSFEVVRTTTERIAGD